MLIPSNMADPLQDTLSRLKDEVGDLADIGSTDIAPLIINLDTWMADKDGSNLFAHKPRTHRQGSSIPAAP